MDSGNGATEAELKTDGFTKEEVAHELDRMRQGRFEFKGDRFVLALFGSRDVFTFALDETRNPKVMKLTSGPDDAEPIRPGTRREPVQRERETLEWIYKFEGERLIVAFGKGTRPPEFKARRYEESELGKPTVPAIHVVTLKKTDVPPKPDPGPRSPVTVRK
jgi:uncharacterized protein (TIGR03067 family)